MPKFIDLSGVDPDKIIYSAQTQEQLEANLWSLLRYTETLRELGIPMKRAVLLEGGYGEGKTVTAMLTAKIAVAQGWTFLMCRPAEDDLKAVMATARLYQPAVVFFEDIDVIAEGSKDHISELLDIFDGIRAKSTQIMCVLTTNHVERIHKGLMRPGRLDAIIQINPLDAAGIERLAHTLVPDEMMSDNIQWSDVCKAMAGYPTSFCKEAIDHAVRYNVARNKGEITLLATADFVGAALGLRRQRDLMERATEGQIKPDPLAASLASVVEGVVEDVVHAKLQGADICDDDGDSMYTVQLTSNGRR